MATPPINPYAPSESAAADAAAEAKAPSRGIVVLASLLGGALLPGLGLLLLGRRRRFLCWTAAGVVAVVTFIAAGLASCPRLFAAAGIATVGVGIAGLVDSVRARPLPGKPLPAPWLVITAAVVLGVGFNVLLRARFLEAFQMPSGSMMPTLLVGDHFFVDKLHRNPARGDIIVFKYPLQPTIDYVKRVIAVGGDHIEMRAGVLWLNGKELPQKALGEPCAEVDYPAACSAREEALDGRSHGIYRAVGLEPFAPPTDVPAGHVYVVGDDRDASNDSRAWGTVPLPNVKGKALWIVWSRAADDEIRWPRVGKVLR